MAEEETQRERWKEWEERTGYEREKKGRRESRPSIHEWAKKKAKSLRGEVMKRAAEGGFTTRPFSVSNPNPSKGLVVSLHPKEGFNLKLDLRAGDLYEDDVGDEVEAWIAKSLERIVDNDEEHLGGWAEKDEQGRFKRLHLDISRVIRDEGRLSEAMKAGKANNQIAIFRLSDFTEHKTGGTGE